VLPYALDEVFQFLGEPVLFFDLAFQGLLLPHRPTREMCNLLPLPEESTAFPSPDTSNHLMFANASTLTSSNNDRFVHF